MSVNLSEKGSFSYNTEEVKKIWKVGKERIDGDVHQGKDRGWRNSTCEG